ncbi:MAG: hypothetical protein JW944_14220, partial [Deltaproteobacteria bacterium]|nr:hypothetical protein [Deltaproteobacteria bacterium]
VLFGPQSTMYGSNAPGGVVNVITAAPKTDRYSAEGTVEYGSYNLLNLQAVFNAPVFRDKIAMRLAANRSSQDPYVEGDSESETMSARLKALYQASENLSFTLTTNWQKRGSGGMTGGSVKAFAYQDDVDDPWTPVDSDEGGGGNLFDQITKGVTANIDWVTPFGTISAVPSYTKTTSDGHGTRTAGGGGPGGGPPPGPPPMSFTGLMAQQAFYPQQAEEEEELIGYYQEDRNLQKGAELRMTNAADFELFQWIFGGTYYKSEQSRQTLLEDEAGSYSARETNSNKKALYANISYPLWFYDKFALTVGYRQSWDKNYSTEIGGPMSGTTGNKEGYSKPDWKYGFEYNVADNMMFYGNFSSSYRSASAMGMPGGGVQKPEELDAYTGGMKSRWFGNKLQVNVSGFFYDYANKLCSGFKVWENITEEDIGFIDNNNNGVWDPGVDVDYMGQEVERGRVNAVIEPDGEYPTRDHLDADNDGNTDEVYVFTANEPGAQGYGAFQSLGLDLQTSWIITSRDRLNFSVSYLDSEWIDLHFEYNWYMIWPPEDYEGITPVNSPKLSMTASYERSIPLGAFGTLTPRIDAQYKSEYTMLWDASDAEEEAFSYQEPYYLWDAAASFNHASGRWSLNAYVKNITNYAVKRSYHGMTGNRELRIGDPRTYGASFSIKF